MCFAHFAAFGTYIGVCGGGWWAVSAWNGLLHIIWCFAFFMGHCCVPACLVPFTTQLDSCLRIDSILPSLGLGFDFWLFGHDQDISMPLCLHTRSSLQHF